MIIERWQRRAVFRGRGRRQVSQMEINAFNL